MTPDGPIPARTLAHGIDAVEVVRIAQLIERHGDRFLERVYTPGERAYAEGRKRRFEHLAARFAAKEAALKALGTGWRSGIAWTDIEVVSLPSGQPTLRVTGRAGEEADRLGARAWMVSISHTNSTAYASVLALGD